MAWSLLSVAVGLVLILWIRGVISGRVSTPVPARRLWFVAVPFGLGLLWTVVQVLPVRLLDGLWHPLRGEAPRVGGSVSISISVNPQRTLDALMRLAACAAILVMAAFVASGSIVLGVSGEVTVDRLLATDIAGETRDFDRVGRRFEGVLADAVGGREQR